MAQIFRPRSNAIARAILLAVVLSLGGAGWVAWGVQNSSYATGQHVAYEQPIPFSHEHHVGGLGIDCRYCHTTATVSPFAGIPPTSTCMTCHSQIWTNAPMLQPVRDSWRNNEPIRWNRVHQLPGYVYFDHSAHVNKGVGCATCHGPVDRMPLMWQFAPLTMSWCIQCHRDPAPNLRPREEVFNMNYTPPADPAALGQELMERYQVHSRQLLTNCSTCHR